MEKSERYNTQVRRAMSDAYVTCRTELKIQENQLQAALQLLSDEKETIKFSDYVAIRKRINQLREEIKKKNVELEIWDKAREICLNVSDELQNKK